MGGCVGIALYLPKKQVYEKAKKPVHAIAKLPAAFFAPGSKAETESRVWNVLSPDSLREMIS